MANFHRFGFFFLLVLLVFGTLQESNAQSYKAVVVPFKPVDRLIPNLLREQNTARYVSVINDSRGQADIVVFPENGITSLKPLEENQSHLEPIGIVVPPVNTATFSEGSIFSNISTVAKNVGVYVVINVLEKYNDPKDSMKFYSTDLVFDLEGKLIAKCRKKRLFKESHYTQGEINQSCTFLANFRRIGANVEFVLLFDTDLLTDDWKKPGIHDAILTSSLQNELPLSFGLSLQQGFAVRNKVNLLASGYSDSKQGYGGSGIYLLNGESKVILGSALYLSGDVLVDQKQNDAVKVRVTPSRTTDVLQNVIYRSFKAANDTEYCTLGGINTTDLHPYRWVSFTNHTQILGQSVSVCVLIKSEENKNDRKPLNQLTVEMSIETERIIQALPLSLGVDSTDSMMVPANFLFTQQDNKDAKRTTMKMHLSEPSDLSVFGFVFIVKSNASVNASYLLFVCLLPLLSILWSKIFI